MRTKNESYEINYRSKVNLEIREIDDLEYILEEAEFRIDDMWACIGDSLYEEDELYMEELSLCKGMLCRIVSNVDILMDRGKIEEDLDEVLRLRNLIGDLIKELTERGIKKVKLGKRLQIPKRKNI